MSASLVRAFYLRSSALSLLKASFGARLQLSPQGVPLLGGPQDAWCPARRGPRGNLPGILPAPHLAPDGRHRHPEQAHDLLPTLAPVDGGEHSQPQVF